MPRNRGNHYEHRGTSQKQCFHSLGGVRVRAKETHGKLYISQQRKENISSRVPLKIIDNDLARKVASERCARPNHPKDLKHNRMDFDIWPSAVGFLVFCLKTLG